MVLYSELVAVGFPDGAVLVRPCVPYAGTQVMDVIAFLLPYPQQFVYCAFPICAADRKDRELFRKIITVDYPEFFHCMGRGAVLPAGTHLAVSIPDAVCKYVAAVLYEYLISLAHV